MSVHNKILLCVVIFFSSISFSAIKKNNVDPNIVEELTGYSAQELDYKAQVEKANEHLAIGESAFKTKNYAQALTEYNKVIAKYKNIKLAMRSAYLGKARLFNEMGLMEQAKANAILAKESSSNNIAK